MKHACLISPRPSPRLLSQSCCTAPMHYCMQIRSMHSSATGPCVHQKPVSTRLVQCQQLVAPVKGQLVLTDCDISRTTEEERQWKRRRRKRERKKRRYRKGFVSGDNGGILYIIANVCMSNLNHPIARRVGPSHRD